MVIKKFRWFLLYPPYSLRILKVDVKAPSMTLYVLWIGNLKKEESLKLLFVKALLRCLYILNWTPFCANLKPHAPSIQKLSPKLKHTINSFSLNKTQHNEMLKIVNCTCCNIQNTLEQLNYWHITTLYTSRIRLSESTIFCFSTYFSTIFHT